MFSRAVGRQGHRKQNHRHVGSARSVSATLGLPAPTACVLSQSTLLRLQVALQRAGPGLHALPRSKPLRFRFSGTPQRHRLSWACVFVPFHDLSSSGDQVLGESTLPRCGASYHHPGPSHSVSRARPSPGCRVSLLGGADLCLLPSQRCQPPRISGSLG